MTASPLKAHITIKDIRRARNILRRASVSGPYALPIREKYEPQIREALARRALGRK